MSHFELHPFRTPSALATHVAERWIASLRTRKNLAENYCVALPGGRITRDVFTSAARDEKTRAAMGQSVHFFWGDERCVPPEDAESNFRAAAELLFAPLNVRAEQIHRIHGEAEADSAAAAAEAELCRLAPLNAAGQPQLDLVLLGMGEDGHVASLFPGESEIAATNSATYRVVIGPKPPPQRITLGYATLAAAREIWVLASGSGKEKALRESLAPHGSTPLARVLRERSDTHIFTDIPL